MSFLWVTWLLFRTVGWFFVILAIHCIIFAAVLVFHDIDVVIVAVIAHQHVSIAYTCGAFGGALLFVVVVGVVVFSVVVVVHRSCTCACCYVVVFFSVFSLILLWLSLL